jgi:hypothetical protein
MAETPGGRISEDGRSVIVTIVSGTPETGLWCAACLLPAVIHVPVHMLTESGPKLLATYIECVECGAHPGVGRT